MEENEKTDQTRSSFYNGGSIHINGEKNLVLLPYKIYYFTCWLAGWLYALLPLLRPLFMNLCTYRAWSENVDCNELTSLRWIWDLFSRRDSRGLQILRHQDTKTRPRERGDLLTQKKSKSMEFLLAARCFPSPSLLFISNIFFSYYGWHWCENFR